MNFLNPFFLLGSLALAVPVLIHLVRREKSEIVPFSSLMFLLKVPKRAIRQQQIKNLLLLILRLLILAFLVATFMRPYVTESAAPAVAGLGTRGEVLLLDNSYSMRYGSNFDRLKREAVKRIDALGASDRMALIAFNDSATVLAMPTSDKGRLKAAVSALEPSYGGTRFYEAFSVGDRVLGELNGQEKHLTLISDFQKVGWNRSSHENLLEKDVKTEMVPVGVEQSANIGIDSVSVDPTTFSRTYTGRVIARIHNYQRDKAATVPVSILINDKEIGKRSLTVSANSTALAEFSSFELPLGASKGKIRIDVDDPLAVDNEFLFALERREKLNLLIIDSGRAKQSFFLQQAFTSSTELPYEVKVVAAPAVSMEALNASQVVIVNDVPRLSDSVRDRLGELRKSGQGQLVILADNADISWWNGVAGFPVKANQKIYVAKDRRKPSFSLTTFDRSHAIFKAFQANANFSLNSAQFFAFTELEPKTGAAVLAKFEDGSPALVESPSDAKGMLVFASAVDNPLKWNDFVLKPSFLPLFHEIVRYLARYNEIRGWYALGEGIPVLGGQETAAAAVITPNGERQSLGDLGPGEQRFFNPIVPGFHELRVSRDVRTIAVNPPSNEGNLDAMLPEDLLASVQSTEAEGKQTGFFAQDEQTDYARRQLGWWYLLLIALLAGIAEIYIANKRSRQPETVNQMTRR